MFVVDRNRELVGYSLWPWDSIYTPLVGCFHNGRLTNVAACDLSPQPRVLEGPRHAWWFRMKVDPDTRFLIEQGDPSVLLQRLEDGEAVPYARPVEGERSVLVSVEDLAHHPARGQPAPLGGFTAFASAPLAYQLEMLYFDILKRAVDESAMQSYLPRMESGLTILEMRDELVDSDEFRSRGIGVSDRVGALVTSSIWNDLARSEAIGEWPRPMRRISLADYCGMSDEDFVAALHFDCHGDDLPDAGRGWLEDMTRENGRAWLAGVLVRDIAAAGTMTDLRIEA